MAPIMVGGRFIMQLQTAVAVANSRAVSAVNINIKFLMFQMSLSGKIQKVKNILSFFLRSR